MSIVYIIYKTYYVILQYVLLTCEDKTVTINMKKGGPMFNKKIFKMVFLVGLVSVFFLASACSGDGDWCSEPLPGGYVVMRANTKDISLCLPTDEYLADIIIEPCITKVAYNDDYVMLQRKDVVSEIKSFKDFKKTFKRYYYLVVVKTQEVLGPYSKDEFVEQASKLEIEDVTWTPVNSLKKQED